MAEQQPIQQIPPQQQQPPMPLPQAIPSPAMPVPVQQGNTSLYVGDLSPDVTETNLFAVFSAVGAVASIRVCRDSNTRRSLGYAYVNFLNPNDADRAIDTLNYSHIRGVPCRIMWSQRDPTARRSGSGNIFIKNLSKTIDQKALADTFSMFGNILSCKVVEDEMGVSKGYGFVHFETQVAADAAIEKVNGKILDGQKVYVGIFTSKKERGGEDETAVKFNNLFVKSLPADYDDEKLKALFEPYGAIVSAVITKDDAGVSKEFGFVCFEDPDNAKKAMEELNEKEIDGKNILVTRAQKKAERMADLRHKFEQERLSKPQGVNLYVKNLEDNVDDDQLRSIFSPYGTITSARVMRDDKGTSKGFGFICFSSPDEATAAVTAVNGHRVGNKPLYVALAQRKEERTQQLTQQYSQRQPGLRLQGPPPLFAMQPPPMIPYGQPMMAKPPRWGAAGARGAAPGPYGPMGYVGVPMQQQRPPRGPPGARGGAMRGAPRVMQPQQRPPQRGFKYAPNVRNVQMPGMPIMPQGNGIPPQQMNRQMFSAQEPLTATMLASADPDTQKRMLGERLFPIIRNTNPEESHKITGMLLEMDNSELLHLLEAPEALQQKVAEAEAVLAQHRSKQKEDEGVSNDGANFE